eukprot:403365121
MESLDSISCNVGTFCFEPESIIYMTYVGIALIIMSGIWSLYYYQKSLVSPTDYRGFSYPSTDLAEMISRKLQSDQTLFSAASSLELEKGIRSDKNNANFLGKQNGNQQDDVESFRSSNDTSISSLGGLIKAEDLNSYQSPDKMGATKYTL